MSPKEYFITQAKLHGIPLSKKFYERLDLVFPDDRNDQFQFEEATPVEEVTPAEEGDQAFNISGQEIAQVASVGPPPLPPLPSKEITSQDLSKETHDVTRAETNYRTIYDLAKEIGIKFPEVAAAQFGQESKWGLKESGKNNYWGIKATQKEIDGGQAVYLPTIEYVNGRRMKTYAWFKHFPTIRAALEQYKREWNDDFMDRKGAVNANSAEEAIQLIYEGGYATDPAYIDSIKVLLREYKDLNKEPEQKESSTISGRSDIA